MNPDKKTDPSLGPIEGFSMFRGFGGQSLAAGTERRLPSSTSVSRALSLVPSFSAGYPTVLSRATTAPSCTTVSPAPWLPGHTSEFFTGSVEVDGQRAPKPTASCSATLSSSLGLSSPFLTASTGVNRQLTPKASSSFDMKQNPSLTKSASLLWKSTSCKKPTASKEGLKRKRRVKPDDSYSYTYPTVAIRGIREGDDEDWYKVDFGRGDWDREERYQWQPASDVDSPEYLEECRERLREKFKMGLIENPNYGTESESDGSNASDADAMNIAEAIQRSLEPDEDPREVELSHLKEAIRQSLLDSANNSEKTNRNALAPISGHKTNPTPARTSETTTSFHDEDTMPSDTSMPPAAPAITCLLPLKPASVGIQEEKYECGVCGKMAGSKSRLQRHVRETHGTKEPKHACSKCKIYKRQRLDHVRQHEKTCKIVFNN